MLLLSAILYNTESVKVTVYYPGMLGFIHAASPFKCDRNMKRLSEVELEF